MGPKNTSSGVDTFQGYLTFTGKRLNNHERYVSEGNYLLYLSWVVFKRLKIKLTDHFIYKSFFNVTAAAVVLGDVIRLLFIALDHDM